MKTVVYQSFRTSNVPAWITECMRTAREWAESRGFDYRFADDSFLELAPAWYREKCGPEICPVTDLARLVMARQLLDSGYDRTVWLDADILVFAPERMNVDVPGFGFGLETWTRVDAHGLLQFVRRVNNSVAVFTRGQPQLDFFIDAAQRLASSLPSVSRVAISTDFLSGLGKLLPLPLVGNVGIFSPVLMRDIASGEERILPTYAAQLPRPLAAANLCNSLEGRAAEGHVASTRDYEIVIEKCLRTRGDVVNRHVKAAAAAPAAA
jgi:hypothetical protein